MAATGRVSHISSLHLVWDTHSQAKNMLTMLRVVFCDTFCGTSNVLKCRCRGSCSSTLLLLHRMSYLIRYYSTP